MSTLSIDRLSGVWSATPTPFTSEMRIDLGDVQKLVEHHLRLGVKGLFVGGTCGEGAWMRPSELRCMTRAVVEASAGRLLVAVQVTDNSADRIAENMDTAAADGADLAVIAPPYFLLNATPANVLSLYTESIARSPLPVGIYDRGSGGAVSVPDEILPEIYGLEKVVLVKDSSMNEVRRDIALAARAARPGLRLLNGYEFDCVSYLRAGYDGLLLGGGIFNGFIAGRIVEAVAGEDQSRALALQERMIRLMYDVYGGEGITCWLTGLKTLLVRMGVFSSATNYLGYPLTDDCSAAIDCVLTEDADILLP
ncbi:MAG: dihydrodipicolinate synthase family protein [Lentisphaeria bacterium]|nr:dihydrodipicolinate synthase family protein [Lentisphaeria bacterium]